MQCSSQVFECGASPVAAAKSQSQKLTLLLPVAQTLFLLQLRSAPKSVSVYGSPILLVMGAPRSFAACPKTAAARSDSLPAATSNSHFRGIEPSPENGVLGNWKTVELNSGGIHPGASPSLSRRCFSASSRIISSTKLDSFSESCSFDACSHNIIKLSVMSRI
jgi:hypothetical protein